MLLRLVLLVPLLERSPHFSFSLSASLGIRDKLVYDVQTSSND